MIGWRTVLTRMLARTKKITTSQGLKTYKSLFLQMVSFLLEINTSMTFHKEIEYNVKFISEKIPFYFLDNEKIFTPLWFLSELQKFSQAITIKDLQSFITSVAVNCKAIKLFSRFTKCCFTVNILQHGRFRNVASYLNFAHLYITDIPVLLLFWFSNPCLITSEVMHVYILIY